MLILIMHVSAQGINENNYGQVASGYCNPSIEKAGKTVFRLSQVRLIPIISTLLFKLYFYILVGIENRRVQCKFVYRALHLLQSQE